MKWDSVLLNRRFKSLESLIPKEIEDLRLRHECIYKLVHDFELRNEGKGMPSDPILFDTFIHLLQSILHFRHP